MVRLCRLITGGGWRRGRAVRLIRGEITMSADRGFAGEERETNILDMVSFRLQVDFS